TTISSIYMKRIRFNKLVVLLFALAPALYAQDSDLRLSSSQPTVDVGDAIQVRASLEASILVTPAIEFTTSNSAIATIDGDGVVRGVFPGIVAIKAHERTIGADAQIDLKIIPSRIEISPGTAFVRLGESMRFSARAFDNSGNSISGVNFRFASSAPSV